MKYTVINSHRKTAVVRVYSGRKAITSILTMPPFTVSGFESSLPLASLRLDSSPEGVVTLHTDEEIRAAK